MCKVSPNNFLVHIVSRVNLCTFIVLLWLVVSFSNILAYVHGSRWMNSFVY